MSTSERRVFSDLVALSAEAAEHFSGAAANAVSARGRFLVALSGGGTPQRLYQMLSVEPYVSAVPWQLTHFFWGDERMVPGDDEGSNYNQVYQTLLSKVPAPAGNIHRVRGELSTDAASQQYQIVLSRFAGPEEAWPVFDLVLLGLGNDGHTASLFPGPIPPEHARSPVAAVTAHYDGRPAHRITLTPLIINQAREIMFLVAGASKRLAFQMATTGPEDPERWPAQRIQPSNGKLIWYVDAAVVGGLHNSKQAAQEAQ